MSRKLAGLLILAAACQREGPAAAPVEVAPPLPPVSPPAEAVFAAAHDLGVVDPASGRVVRTIPLGRRIDAVVVAPGGDQAFLATTGGLFVGRASTSSASAISNVPALAVSIDPTGTRLSILQHEARPTPSGVIDIAPEHLVVRALPEFGVLSDEEVGRDVIFAARPGGALAAIAVADTGEVRLVAAGAPLRSAPAVPLGRLTAPAGRMRVRPEVLAVGDRVFVPYEGEPSTILEVDLARRAVRPLELGRRLALRGMALSPDGHMLRVSAADRLVSIRLADASVVEVMPLPVVTAGLALSRDGRWAYLAETADGLGGAIVVVRLETGTVHRKVHLDGMSPWLVAR